MAGFLISNMSISSECPLQYPDKSVSKSFEYKGYKVRQQTNYRFIDDKICEQCELGAFVIEGAILNKLKLIEENGAESWLGALCNMYHKREDFFVDFRGSFAGAVYKQENDEWLVYTNHLADHQLFYWSENGKFIVSTDLNWLVLGLKENGINYTLDKDAVNSMLSYGWIHKDGTIISEVKKLLPGNYIKFIGGEKVDIYSYYTLDNAKLTKQSEAEIINTLDEKFRIAVALEYEKNIEYGYKQLGALSGGLDSRMNIWVAYDMGYRDITAVTMGQSGCEDITIACQIANKLHLSHIIKTLDDAGFSKYIEHCVKYTFGLLNVQGCVNGKKLRDLLNYDGYGLYHTGLAGDAIIGSKWRTHVRPLSLVGAIIGGVNLINYDKQWKNEELYFFNERVFKWTMGVQCIAYETNPYASPFLDIDFLDYCFSIPLRYRYKHGIYKKWILQKYPEAAESIWETTGCKINESEFVGNLRRKYRNVERKLQGISEKSQGMNPFDYWYDTIPSVKEDFDKMYQSKICNQSITDDIRTTIEGLYNSHNCMYKIQILSVLTAIDMYF